MSGENGGATQRLVSLARNLRFDDIPPDALEVARHCLLDWFGVALAGSSEPLSEILRAQVAAAEGGDEASLIGCRSRACVRTAALVNGAASHALDFDDTHMVMFGHPTVPVLPAALALAERDDQAGQALLTALVAGIELECRLGALVNPNHYEAGFHATGTLGTFGAAAAAAHLLELTEEQWLHAMGLAGTQAAGLKSGFGTMAKPLHAGKAAADGLLAALLAQGGFTANPAIVEADQGFATTHDGGRPAARVLDRYEGRFLVLETLFKVHAACYLTHSGIEGALKLRRELSLDPEAVAEVELHVAPSSLAVCNIAEPVTGLEGKFSLRATTAMALLGDEMGDLRSYSPERMAAPDLVALRERVRVVPVDGVSPTHSTVIVRTRDGQRHEASVDTGVPATDLDVQWDRLSAKFFTLARPVLGEAQSRDLHEAVASVHDLSSVRELVALATPAGVRSTTTA